MKLRNKKKKNLIKDGRGQAPNLVKESEWPQMIPVPCTSGDRSTNTSQTHLNPSSQTAVKRSLSESSNMAKPTEVAANHCTECNMTFKSPARLNRHRHRTHSTEDTFRCPDCNKPFPSPGSVTQHRSAKHNHVKQSSQTAVKQSLSQSSNRTKHQAVPTGVAANQTSNMAKHQAVPTGVAANQSSNMAKHHAVPTGVAADHCTACNITFRSPARLNRHCHKAHSTEDTVGDTFRCPDCDTPFPSPGSVTQHRIVMHNVQNIYQCSVCNIIVKNASCLNQHHRITHGFSKCSECSEEFTSLALLKQHQWEVHNIGKLLTCKICNESFINFTMFIKHCKSHTYQCSVCNFSFKRPLQLHKHMKTHI